MRLGDPAMKIIEINYSSNLRPTITFYAYGASRYEKVSAQFDLIFCVAGSKTD